MTEVQPQPHGHRKYVIAVIVVAIVALLTGVLIGYQIAPTGITLVQGRVSLNSQEHGVPYFISFVHPTTGNLTSAVENQTYLVYLPTGYSFTVTVGWLNMTSGSPSFGFHACNPQPSTYIPSAQNETRNFTC